MKGADIDLMAHNSEGLLANMYGVVRDPHSQLGIVQSDVLQFLAYSKNKEAQKMVNKTRLVYPLYNEEVHVFSKANSALESLSDLEEKRIALGPENGGSAMTGRALYPILQPAGVSF